MGLIEACLERLHFGACNLEIIYQFGMSWSLIASHMPTLP